MSGGEPFGLVVEEDEAFLALMLAILRGKRVGAVKLAVSWYLAVVGSCWDANLLCRSARCVTTTLRAVAVSRHVRDSAAWSLEVCC